MRAIRTTLATIAMIGTCSAASAQVAPTGDWEYTANIYLWGAGLDAEFAGGGDLSLSFGDILDNLDFGLMGGFAARRGDLTLFFDGIYLDIKNSADVEFNPGPGPGTPGVVDLDLDAFVTTFGAGYNVIATDNATLTAFGGLRALFLDADISAETGAPPGGALSISEDNWDGVVGVRGRSRLSDDWAVSYYLDLGAGDSHFTWQGLISANYMLESWDISLGYRWLDWDFGSDEPITDLRFSGPFLGAAYRF